MEDRFHRRRDEVTKDFPSSNSKRKHLHGTSSDSIFEGKPSKGGRVDLDWRYLHHFQFLGVGQIAGHRLVAGDVVLDVDVGAEDEPLLDVGQQLRDDAVEGGQLFR